MAVYVDPMKKCMRNRNWNYDKACHMIADTPSELKKFAKRMGLKLAWYQAKSFPHFDLVGSMRDLAIEEGAIQLSTRDLVFKMREIREANK